MLQVSGGQFLHGHQTQHNQQVVLHHVLDDAKFTQVAAPALSTKGLLEGEDDADDVFPIPDVVEDSVSKP